MKQAVILKTYKIGESDFPILKTGKSLEVLGRFDLRIVG